MYTGVDVHSDVARESYSFDLFDVPLHIPLECKKAGIFGLCIPVDSFDLRCESVTLNNKHLIMIVVTHKWLILTKERLEGRINIII